jgi:hypothetical protein
MWSATWLRRHDARAEQVDHIEVLPVHQPLHRGGERLGGVLRVTP